MGRYESKLREKHEHSRDQPTENRFGSMKAEHLLSQARLPVRKEGEAETNEK